jgi:multidrug resistance efflux pump
MSPPTAAAVRRRGFSVRGPVIALVAVAVPAIGWFIWSGMSWSSQDSGPAMHKVEKGEFVHEITDRGNLESAENTEIKCEVRSKNNTGTQILDIVPEGTEVTEQNVMDGAELVRSGAKITDQDVLEGRVLVRLDSSSLEIDKINQEILLAKAKAEESQAFAAHEAAKSALKEYLGQESLDETDVAVGPVRPIAFRAAGEPGAAAPSTAAAKTQDVGTADQQRRAIESEIAVAEENYSRAKQYLKYSLGLYGKGYVTRLQLQADRFAMDKAETDLEIARTKLDVFNRFTHDKQKTQLTCDLRTARARLDAAEASRKLNEKFLGDINEQLSRCIIVPKKPGQVVYANVNDYRGSKQITIAPGEITHERQVLLRLPNPDKMQVVARVNEAKVTLVKPNMPAKVRLDAFPDVELTGSVVKVNAFPASSGWMGSVVKEYETTVRIDDPPPGMKLKPGLTAQVRILVERRSKALQVKVQSVFEHGGKFYCVVPEGRAWAARAVQLGPSNDKFVVIEGGLDEGDEIVLNASAYREKVKLSDVPGDGGARGAKRRKAPAGLPPEQIARKQREAAAEAAEQAKVIFDQRDKDHDGFLTSAEIPEPWRSRLQSVDTNHDGKIDLAELTAAIARAAAAAGNAGGTGPKAKPAP